MQSVIGRKYPAITFTLDAACPRAVVDIARIDRGPSELERVALSNVSFAKQ